MKKTTLSLILVVFFGLTIPTSVNAQDKTTAFKAGEWLKFRIHYGIFNASFATLQLKNDSIDTIPVFHAVGKGRTTGLARLFFKVDDVYESYFGKNDLKPYRFIRKIDEGGYTKDLEIDFNYQTEQALMTDNKKKTKKNYEIHQDIQDIISASYYLRDRVDTNTLKKGDAVDLDMLFDEAGIYNFKLKYLGKDVLRTKYGKVECLKFRPLVQAGRIFKEKESLTLWVSNDLNRIPIRVKADLAVGSLKADLDGFNGLRNQFKILMK
ncbi:DUF3108 domain-containing protein [Aureicoccus marinus]|uniref:ATP-dependent exonuclease n=1 Tax=Aureicoccus marinus TaxID=754435 RepID=A0A2S7T8W5_9FLAO|nr:DUF3108 domain-containing protein [Aureicoccus marinus]PQJ16373.1 ATP-dependent exonuclease [Aureicoccus marinus]